MLRRFVSTLFAVVIVASCLLAAEYKGKVKSVDADKGTITVTVDDKDMEIKVTDDTKIVNAKGKDVTDRLKAKQFAKAGGNVVVTTEKKDGKEVATEIKVMGGKKKNQ